MSLAQLILFAVVVQRGLELLIARRNTERLLEQGAVEHGASHYPHLVVLHALWLVALVLSVPADRPIAWPWLATYGVLSALRIWTMASLGRFWTTRILTLPGEKLVSRGPYRFTRHPNYWIVAGEIAVLPLVFGEWWLALGFSVVNAILIRERILVEDQALAPRRSIARES